MSMKIAGTVVSFVDCFSCPRFTGHGSGYSCGKSEVVRMDKYHKRLTMHYARVEDCPMKKVNKDGTPKLRLLTYSQMLDMMHIEPAQTTQGKFDSQWPEETMRQLRKGAKRPSYNMSAVNQIIGTLIQGARP